MQGLTGLHLAAKHGKLDCMRYLLDHCDISVDLLVPHTGNTPLHCSILGKTGGRTVQCMKLLLDRGASRNQYVTHLVTGVVVSLRSVL